MTPPLIRIHKKPRFGFPWLALLLGIGTVFFTVQGYQAITATPTAQLEIVVEGQHGLNISQASVNAVVGEGIKTWQPMRILVTPRILSHDEKKGRQDLGADVILSTIIDDDPTTSINNRRFAGVGIYPASGDNDKDLHNTLEIRNAFMDNVGLGHGPKAVAAAAQRAAEVLDKGPLQSPLFWLMGVVIGFGLTIIALAFSLSRRQRRELIFRRLTKAQRKLAKVVLELEALEVSYLATPWSSARLGLPHRGAWFGTHRCSWPEQKTLSSMRSTAPNPRCGLPRPASSHLSKPKPRVWWCKQMPSCPRAPSWELFQDANVSWTVWRPP
ncbi:LapA family protein [Arthrobacter alpinus]|nr:LapA family protein [Arthrobacter alpinus]